jgi:hypothetical protein
VKVVLDPIVIVLGLAVKLEIDGGFLGLTVTVALDETDFPTASVMTTVTVEVPVAVGVQLKEDTFWAVHPLGSPE